MNSVAKYITAMSASMAASLPGYNRGREVIKGKDRHCLNPRCCKIIHEGESSLFCCNKCKIYYREHEKECEQLVKERKKIAKEERIRYYKEKQYEKV